MINSINNQSRIWQTPEGECYHNCVMFWKTKDPFGGLSNMAKDYSLNVNNITFLFPETLYQICRFPHYPKWQQEIIEQRNPVAAKLKTRENNREQYSRSDWEQIRVDVMRWVLRVKLAQHYSSISQLLIETGNCAIVEKSRHDPFWGAVENEKGVLLGNNQLGKLWMEIRELLKTSSCHEIMIVEPLAIPNFLLLGQPINTVKA